MQFLHFDLKNYPFPNWPGTYWLDQQNVGNLTVSQLAHAHEENMSKLRIVRSAVVQLKETFRGVPRTQVDYYRLKEQHDEKLSQLSNEELSLQRPFAQLRALLWRNPGAQQEFLQTGDSITLLDGSCINREQFLSI
jgi:hypothetical protein